MVLRAVSLAGIALLALAGCALMQQTTTVCVDWAGPLPPDELAEFATVVIVGEVTGRSGTRQLFNEDAPVHTVAVERVLKGDVTAYELEVAAVPQTCNGEMGTFPDGDPLEVDGRVELLLAEVDGQYQLASPWNAVLEAPAGDPLPWEPAGD